MNKFEEMLKKLLENDVCYLYQNGKFVYRVSYHSTFKSQIFVRVVNSHIMFCGSHVIGPLNIDVSEILTKEEVNKKYGECTMNKFQENIDKLESLKNSNKLAYLKFENHLVRVDEIEKDFGSVVFKHFTGICCANYRLLNTNDFQILNEEEFLKESAKKIESRLMEIEEEKKHKLEAGKTYVIRRKGNDSCHYCYIKDFTNKCFYRQIDFSESKWFNISDFDFQKVDISIHEFFTTDPKSHWKN